MNWRKSFNSCKNVYCWSLTHSLTHLQILARLLNKPFNGLQASAPIKRRALNPNGLGMSEFCSVMDISGNMIPPAVPYNGLSYVQNMKPQNSRKGQRYCFHQIQSISLSHSALSCIANRIHEYKKHLLFKNFKKPTPEQLRWL